jgi:hypothetical protein
MVCYAEPMRIRSLFVLPAAVLVAIACGSSNGGGFEASDAGDGGGDGFVPPPIDVCSNGKMCVGNEIHTCDENGKAGAKVGECTGQGEVCLAGSCRKGCDAAAVLTSNVGCEFWAVDLDNEYNAVNDAAGAPWGLAISNAGDVPAEVVVEQNDATPGSPAKVTLFKRIVVAPRALQVLEMPTREVDGSLLGKNEGPGTMLSAQAFRIKSSEPVVIYQFNALRAQYSNDASLLIPTSALGRTYRALSWPSGKPISVFGSPIDRGYLTVVGTSESTKVSVRVSQAIVAGGGIPATPKGGLVEVTLGPFEVLNLETDGMPGDLTASVVVASNPVAVFVGTELSGGITSPSPTLPEGASSCCLDHLEEQLLPVESYGKKFTVPRSPPRGGTEPDYIRFMGVASAALVRTNLPAPDDSFTLEPGQVRDTLVKQDFVVDATEPVAVGQILVSAGYTNDGIGDPSLSVLPAVDQFRSDYLFLVPGSWRKNYVVISMPQSGTVKIDGNPLGADCTNSPMGTIDATAYVARRCPLPEGAHTMTGDQPFGIVAYGYGSAGSYAFVGGSNVKKIYNPPPLK